MRATTLAGTILDIDVQTVPEFLKQARLLLELKEGDELKWVDGDNTNDMNMILIVPLDHFRELMKIVWRCYRANVYINTDSVGMENMFSDAFYYYRQHFNPPEMQFDPNEEVDLHDKKCKFFERAYEFEELIMNLHPFSQQEPPTQEMIMEKFVKMYEAYQDYDDVEPFM